MKKLMFSYGTGKDAMQLFRDEDVCLVGYQGTEIPFSLNPALLGMSAMSIKFRFGDNFPFEKLIVAAYGALRKVSPKAYVSFHPNIVILNGEVLGRVHNNSTEKEEYVRFEYDMEMALEKTIYDEDVVEEAAFSLLRETLWQHHMKELLTSTKLTASEVDFELGKTKETEDNTDTEETDDLDGHDCDTCDNSGRCPIESRVRHFKMMNETGKESSKCKSEDEDETRPLDSIIESMASEAAANMVKAMFGIDPRTLK